MPTIEKIRSSILDMDASTLAEMIASGKISSRQAVEVYIEQIEKMNPTVNCFVEERFLQARNEADEADLRIRESNAQGKLFGVPISMKESFHVKGLQTTGGLLRRKGSFQTIDADIVQKLKEEGAIILGKTNTPELCFCQETDNKLYGRTNNPRDLDRTVGGSSGGEAALIAMGGAAAGIGSDIGGSIRFPCHFNGVIGFKSGKGQVSPKGSYPPEEHDLQKRMLGIGPITKTVKDARLIYSIIAEEEASEKTLDNFTVNVLPKTDLPLSSVTRELLDSVYTFTESLFKTERELPPFFKQSALLWQEIMSIGGAAANGREAFGDKPVRPLRAYISEKLNGRATIHRYLSWALIGATLFKPSAKRENELKEMISHGDDILNDYLRERILIFPVYHTAAPVHGVVYQEIFSIKKTFLKFMPFVAYANVWGLPTLTIPVGTDENGLPISVQIMSANGNEEVIFKLGELIEKSFLGYTRA